ARFLHRRWARSSRRPAAAERRRRGTPTLLAGALALLQALLILGILPLLLSIHRVLGRIRSGLAGALPHCRRSNLFHRNVNPVTAGGEAVGTAELWRETERGFLTRRRSQPGDSEH